MLQMKNTFLLVVDIQGKLAQLMYEKERLFKATQRMIQGAKALGLPIIWTEQIPEKLGPTIPEIALELSGLTPVVKSSFSCCGDKGFLQAVEAISQRQVLLCGIETHVCIYQTARDLLARGYEVHLLVDAVSSRTEENRWVGIEKMRTLGVLLSSMEMALFEVMRNATHESFKEIVKILK